MLLNVYRLPWVADPHIIDGAGCVVSVLGHHVVGKSALLLLVLVVEDEDAEFGLLLHAQLLPGRLDILFQLLHGILESSACIIDLVNDQDALADQVFHAAQAAQVQPLRTCDLVANLLYGTGGGGAALGVDLGQLLVQGQANGLNGDVW